MTYIEKKKLAVSEFLQIKSKGPVSLKPKFTSHFFRDRKKKNKLDLTNFNTVIKIYAKNKIVEVEGLCTFYNLAKECLKHNFLPVIVPELRNITIGGTISGLGLESSSFIFGMVHNSILSCEVLTASGKVIECSRTKNSDLFYTLPNSLGTLGYILKCKFKLKEAKKFVKINLTRYTNANEYFKALKAKCISQNVDFIDGIIFSSKDYVIIEGSLINELPKNEKPRNFKEDIYWQFLKTKNNKSFYMTTFDYLWRWDTDAFWALSTGWKKSLTENKFFRKTLGKIILRSDILGKLNHLTRRFRQNQASKDESILQDLCIDIDKCANFFAWYNKEIQVYPLWICPSNNREGKGQYPLHDFNCDYLVDIGIYTGRERKANAPANFYNKLLEQKVIELNGMKGLYSESFYTQKEFWQIYNKKRYLEMKKKYDPQNIYRDLYAKAVGS